MYEKVIQCFLLYCVGLMTSDVCDVAIDAMDFGAKLHFDNWQRNPIW